MKTTKFIALALIAVINLTACSSDDDSVPEVINEEEVITTVTLTLVPQTGATVTLTSQDLDGDGPNPPVVTVDGDLQAGMVYNGSVELLNETESPAEVVNEEIEEEANEHQFFYQVGAGLDATVTYADTEDEYLDNGSDRPVGIKFKLQAGEASTGTLTVTLRHEPNKDGANVSEGDISNAGGETDVAQTFDVEIK